MRRRGVVYPLPVRSGRAEKDYGYANGYDYREHGCSRSRSRSRGRGRWRKIFLAGICLAGFLWGGQALCTVHEICVSGNRILEREEVTAVAGVQSGRSILLVNPARAVAQLEEMPLVRRATVVRSWPRSVVITIEEREPAAVVAAAGGFWMVDREGVVLGGPSPLSGDLPVVTGLGPVGSGGRVLEPGQIALGREQGQVLERFLRALAFFPGLEVSELNVADPGNLFLFTLDGLQVLLGDSCDLEAKLELVWHSRPYWPAPASGERYVDARLADRLVVAP